MDSSYNVCVNDDLRNKMSNAPTCPTLFNLPHDEINKANQEFVYISDGDAGEICQLYNTYNLPHSTLPELTPKFKD